MSLQSVHPNSVCQVWNTVSPFLDKAMSHSGGEYNLDHLKLFLTEGRQHLLVVVNDENKVIGAITVEFINFPDERIAFVSTIGGKMMTGPDNWAEFEDWCRNNGATMIRGAAFESVARLWKKLFDMESRYIMVEKKL